MDWNDWKGKRIFVKLNSGNYFNGIVEDVTYIGEKVNGVQLYLISIIDKFSKLVAFHSDDILLIKEEGGEK